ncbi:MAG: efflux RND transporter periplasmic adaptor subunit [Treponema sp.]|nr:efflux RND transporter periplasmic adaptor subunit [Treponema sp.]
MKVHKTAVLHFFCFLAVLNVSSCGGKPSVQEEEVRQVRAFAAAIRELPDETSGFGTLSFLTKTDIAAAQEGSIKKIYFREGDTVRTGDLMVLLENPQINLAVGRAEKAYAQAEAAVGLAKSRLLEGEFQAEARILTIEKAEAELEQAKKVWEEDQRKYRDQEVLFEAGGVSGEAMRSSRFALDSEWEQLQLMEKELDIRRIGCRDQDLAAAGMQIPGERAEKARAFITLLTASLGAELDAAKSQLEAAAKELESVLIAESELRIKSPGGGIVGARYLEEGERVKRDDKILTLMDTTSLYALFPVPESEALHIEKGMAALVQIDGSGETEKGKVDLVYPQADSQSFTFLVRVLLDGSGSLNMKPGMFVRVEVTRGPPRQAVVIPESALTGGKDNGDRVFVISNGIVTERRVVAGVSLGSDREIVSGLRAGEAVVLRPDGDLREGTHVAAK